MIYSPPTDRLDRRRRIYRWRKAHRGRFKRGTLLHRDGSVPTLAELMAFRNGVERAPIDGMSKPLLT